MSRHGTSPLPPSGGGAFERMLGRGGGFLPFRPRRCGGGTTRTGSLAPSRPRCVRAPRRPASSSQCRLPDRPLPPSLALGHPPLLRGGGEKREVFASPTEWGRRVRANARTRRGLLADQASALRRGHNPNRLPGRPLPPSPTSWWRGERWPWLLGQFAHSGHMVRRNPRRAVATSFFGAGMNSFDPRRTAPR